jgi:NTE family protein
MPLHWVTGCSAGAVTAALIAGSPGDQRIARLREFWNWPPLRNGRPAAWQHLHGCIGAISTRLIGSCGHFHPRVPPSILSIQVPQPP